MPDPCGGSAHGNRFVRSGCLQTDGLLIKKLAKVVGKLFDGRLIAGCDFDDEGGDTAAFEVAISIHDSEAVK